MSISALAQGEKSNDQLAITAKFIPTEVVAIYVAILAVYDPIKVGTDQKVDAYNFTSRWVLFWIMLGATPLITLGVFKYRVNSTGGPKTFNRNKWLAASFYAMLGLAVWATALADTPWQDFAFWKGGISTAALLVFTLLVPYFPGAKKLDEYASAN